MAVFETSHFFNTSSDSGGSSSSASPCPSSESLDTRFVDPLLALHRLPNPLSQQFSPPLSELDSAYMSSTSSPLAGVCTRPWSVFDGTAGGSGDLLEKVVQAPSRRLFNVDGETRRRPSLPSHAPLSTVSSCVETQPDCRVSLSSSQMMYQARGQTRLPTGQGVEGVDRAMSRQFGNDVRTSPGMRDVPSWLKSLRLHKYTPMFASLTYEEMMTLDETQLEMHNVTKGARRKIIQSINKLKERSNTLRVMEQVMDAGELRSALIELRALVQSPMRGFPSPDTSYLDESLHPENLPGQIVRVLGKLHTAVFETREVDDEHYALLLHIYDRVLNHEAFTATQKQRVGVWKRAVRKVFSPAVMRKRSCPTPAGQAMCNPTTAAYFMGAAAALAASHNPAGFEQARRATRWNGNVPTGAINAEQLQTLQDLFVRDYSLFPGKFQTQWQQQFVFGLHPSTCEMQARNWKSPGGNEAMERLAANLAAMRPTGQSRRASCANFQPPTGNGVQVTGNCGLRRSATSTADVWPPPSYGAAVVQDPLPEFAPIGLPEAARIGQRTSSSGYASSGSSDRSSGADSPPGLMVYNFVELDRMCRSVAELSFEPSHPAASRAGTAFH